MKLLQTIIAPQESVNDDYLSVLKIYLNQGDKVEKDSLIAEIEASKALIEIRSDYDGYIEILVEEDKDYAVGSEMFKIFDSKIDNELKLTEKKIENINSENDLLENNLDLKNLSVNFSNRALSLIKEKKIDIVKFQNYSYVTSNDINNLLSDDLELKTDKIQKSVVKEYSEKIINNTEIENFKFSKSKKTENEYLKIVNSSSVISRLSVDVKIGSSEKISHVQKLISSTPLPLLIFEVSRLLIKYPNLNSFHNNDSKSIYKSVNIGIAFDDGKNGLKVAAVKNADKLNLNSIENKIIDLTTSYVNNKLDKSTLTSSTFTITDLFNSEVSTFHPLVNVNNSSILGVSSLRNSHFNLDLSFDHRITNGKEVSLFLGELKNRLENIFSSPNFDFLDKSKVNCTKCFRDISDDNNGSIYFQKVINNNTNGYLCSICLNGW